MKIEKQENGKMYYMHDALYWNMEQVGKVGETSNRKFSKESLRENQLEQLHTLKKEAEKNSFQVLFNNKNLQEIKL